ncbi:uncharacterized protein LOC101723575 isoform X3 [Heterocephalus glaber]|uniref:Uncharacterized protein LOC101723575 isoform X3 n=1 Tax=Heterocephalus glaber TaxID=10181 RepID=A0AAX6QVS1_HETGA|nr:uncharacterized protein LOC101723575 isoform X3 [Heterocephalus glaber]
MACATAWSPADQDGFILRLLKILQLPRFKMYAQQLDSMYFLRKIKCTLGNGIMMFNTEAESRSNLSRKMAASAWDSSHRVNQ